MAHGEYRSFVFGESLYTILDDLGDSDKDRFNNYIIRYGLYGEEPELAAFERATWKGLKTILDNTNTKRGAPAGNKNAHRQTATQKTNDETIKTIENNSEQLKQLKTIRLILILILNQNLNQNQNP
jgi:hypothetical protein